MSIALSESERKRVINEAIAAGAAKNQTPQKAAWDWAVANGVSAANLDEYMGWDAGTATKWAVDNGEIPAPQGNSVDFGTTTGDTNVVDTVTGGGTTTGGTTTGGTTTGGTTTGGTTGGGNGFNYTGGGVTGGDTDTTAIDINKPVAQKSYTATDFNSWTDPNADETATDFSSWGAGPTKAVTTTEATKTTGSTAPKFNLGTLAGSTDWVVDPKTQTVAGQLESVIANDSPLMQQARARALQGMNARGLVNSSMATGAADSAMYDKALEIAKPDAATYADAGKTNAESKNKFAYQSNDFIGRGSLAEYDTQSADWKSGRDFDRTVQRDQNLQDYDLQDKAVTHNYDLENAEVTQANTVQNKRIDQANTLQTLKAGQTNDIQKLEITGDTARDVANIEAQYKSLTAASASATSILNTMQSSLDRLAANENIQDQETYNAMYTNILTNAMQSLKLIGALATDADLSSYIEDLFQGEA